MENIEIFIPEMDEINQHINSAFDSVDLINEIVVKDIQSEEDTATMDRNVEHLKIMMAYDWFASALTEEQANQINAIIKIDSIINE